MVKPGRRQMTARLDAAESQIFAYVGKGAFISPSSSLLAGHHTELYRLRLFAVLKQIMLAAIAVCVRSFKVAVSVYGRIGLNDGAFGVRFPAEANDFPFLQNTETGCRIHPAKEHWRLRGSNGRSVKQATFNYCQG